MERTPNARGLGEEDWRGQEFTKHRPPLAPKLPKQAASGGRCFVECLTLQTPIDNLGRGPRTLLETKRRNCGSR